MGSINTLARKTLLSVFLIFPLLFNPSPIMPVQAQSQPRPDNNSLLQFTSNGSILGFQADGISTSNGSTSYQVSFVGNKLTNPVADNPMVKNGQATPLTGNVSYPNLWPGITLVYEAPEGVILRSTYQIQPHADAASIRLAYNHPVTIAGDGQLLIDMDGTTLRESAPVAWQMVDGNALPVQVAFQLIPAPNGEQPLVGFELGAYNPDLPLTIDPSLVWNSFFSSSFTRVLNTAIDPTGQYIYAVGYSTSTWGTPLNPFQGSLDITIAKFDTGMNLLWHTFLGSDVWDLARDVDIDANGDIYISGDSGKSWGTPKNPFSGTTSGDAFVAKLDSNGALSWNTFLGGVGSNNEGYQITVSSDAILIAGTTSNASWGSPINPYPLNTLRNGFVAKLDKTTHNRTWHTFFGGGGNPVPTYYNTVDIQGLGIDSSGNVYIGGGSGAYSFTGFGSPIRARSNDSLFDGYVLKLNTNGIFQWYTFVGGLGIEAVRGFDVDSSGNSFITGTSPLSWGSPINAWSAASQWFAARVNSNGSLSWNTFLQNTTGGNFHLLDLDPSSNVYIVGESNASWGSPDPNMPYTGSNDGQILALNSSGALQWHGFLGGASSDGVDTLTVHDADTIYIFGTSNATWGSPLQPWSASNKKFIARVGLANRAPTDISLSPTSIAENEPVNTTIGSLATTDPDTGNLFTYTLVSGTGSTDNDSFNISGVSLRTSASFDYETKTSYTIRVRSTDQSGLWTEKQFTVSITDVYDNAAPTDISLSSATIAENSPVNTVVGALTTTDPDSGNTFTYSLVGGDSSSFNILGANLRTSASFDFETKSSYSVTIRSTDQDGAYFEKAFTITVTNVNESPTDISISSSSVAENAVANTTVGSFTTTDPDSGNTFTYTLVSGTGSDDNGVFNISGANLLTSASFNYETRNSYSIRIRSTDQGGLYTEKQFTITVTNVNESPTDISLSSSSVAENAVANTTVGSFTTTDPDSGNTFTYSLVGGDSSSFNILGANLRTSASFDFETKSSYSVIIRSTDQDGAYFEKAFTITVTNVNESPTDISLSSSSVAENAAENTTVGTLSTTDPDSGNTFTYTLVSGTGSDDNGVFNISGANLLTSASFNFETKNSYSIRIRSTDQGGLYTEKQFTITVTNVNEAPTNIALSTASLAENQVVNTIVGALTTTDPDSDNTFTYTLVTGTGSDDNASFNILSSNLRTSASFDYELKNSYSVRIRSADQGGLSFEKVFNISITDAAENTTTSISSDSPDPSVTGQPYTVAVTVVPASGSGTPGGTVSVNDGTGGTCTVTLSGGSGSCLLASTTTGSKTLTASYITSASWNTSSGTTDHTVTPANSTTTFTSDTPDPSALGESVTFSARVDPVSPAAGFPTGSVDFKEGSTVLCSGTLSSGIAACSYSALTNGDHTISAVYSGSTHFNSSSSASGTHTVELIELDDNKVSTSFTDVGNLSTSGGDAPYTYSLQTSGRLCDATNGAGNGSFEISGSILQRKPASTADTYAICVQSMDASAGTVQRAFSVIINNPPSSNNISLDHRTVSVTQTDVGTFSASDGQDPKVFTLKTTGDTCSAENSSGNSYFSILEDILKRNLDTPIGEYQICVQVMDEENETAQKVFVIDVTNTPDDLLLSRNTVSTSQTDIGEFSVSNGQSPFTYSLQTSGEICNASNGVDNGAFIVDGSTLKRAPSTSGGTYSICAQATDSNGLSTQKVFAIIVTAPPSNITLSSQTVSTAQTIVGTLATIDGQLSFVYSLETSGDVCNSINSAGNASFSITGNALLRKGATSPSIYSVCIQTTDSNGEQFQKTFDILVTYDNSGFLNWGISLSSDRVIDGDAPGTLVGTMIATRDGGAFEGVTYTLTDLDAFPLAANFNLSSDGKLTLATTAHYDVNRYYPIRILATAQDGSTQYLDVVILVMKNGLLNGAIAVDDISEVITTSKVTIDVLANDIFSQSASEWNLHQIVKYPDHGDAVIGSIIYTPDNFWTGVDTMTYRACDNLDYCVVGNVIITVLPISTAPATGFPAGVISPLAKQPQANLYQDMEVLSIEIPRLSVHASIVGVPTTNDGWNITWLGNQVGWLNGTAFPTWNGNSVLTGHLYDSYGKPGIFNELNKLVWGDQIIVHLEGQKYIYEVRETLPNVNPNSLKDFLVHKDSPWITLVTCQGYDEVSNTYRWRYLVRAVLVRVE